MALGMAKACPAVLVDQLWTDPIDALDQAPVRALSQGTDSTQNKSHSPAVPEIGSTRQPAARRAPSA